MCVSALRYLQQTTKFNLEKSTLDSLERTITNAFAIPCPLPRTFTSFVLLKKVYVTPSRIIFGEPVPVAKNRVLREFSEEKFILVDFTDEEGQRLHGGDFCLLERIRAILVPNPSLPSPFVNLFTVQLDGLVLRDRKYHFIFGNARMGSCWFSLLPVKELNLGDFSGISFHLVSSPSIFLQYLCIGIKNPGKVLARISLAVSSSTPTVMLPEPITKAMVVPDITGILFLPAISTSISTFNSTPHTF